MRIGIIDLVIEYQFEVLQNLQKNKSVHLSHALMGTNDNFHGNVGNIISIVDQIFPEGKGVDSITDFLFPDKINQLPAAPWTISEQMLIDLKFLESLYLRITDRASSIPISIQERKLYFLRLLNYFNNVIKDNKLTHILVFDTPHSIASIIYYELAKYHELKVLRFEYHFFPNYCVFANSYELPVVPDDFSASLSKEAIFERLPKEIQEGLTGGNPYFDAYKKGESKAVISSGFFATLNLYKRYVIKVGQNIIMGCFPFLFKKQILHFTSLNGIRSNLRYRLKANQILKKLIQHNLIYNRLSTVPDVKKKFIYFGMHMQPEKSTQPLGGEFDNQYLSTALLASSVPDDWFIYVKEHPNQFNPRKLSNANYRSKSFYQSLLNIDKVRLVPLDYPSDDLIHHAELVATVTGSIGWESLSAGKPIIAFGSAYYKPCHAVGHISSAKQGQQEINRLQALSKDDVQRHLYNYLHYYNEHGYLVNAANWEKKIELSDKSREYHIDKITERIKKALGISKLSTL